MQRFALCLLAVALFISAPGSAVRAEVTLPTVFSDGMVLQHGQPLPVWGHAAPREAITVHFAGQTATATADEDGRWQAVLSPLAVSAQPRDLVVDGAASPAIRVADVLVGEVWLCTGPSNIHWAVKKCDRGEEEVAAANYPQIRFFTVERETADVPQEDCVGSWVACEPETVGDVSGVGYFFCRRVHTELDVPVGLLQSYWGGSRIEAWTSRESLTAEPDLAPILAWWKDAGEAFNADEAQQRHEEELADWREAVKKAKAAGKTPPKRPAAPADPRQSRHRPACLYNGMIAPLVPYRLRGILCYQGLGNLVWADYSVPLLETMVHDWRGRWDDAELPIGMVQPAPYHCNNWASAGPDAYCLQRESQLIIQERLPNIGIALTMDVDAVDVLHFTNKQLVGRRLSSWALDTVYGESQAHVGPTLARLTREGDRLRVEFRGVGEGLSTSDGSPPRHFQVAGSDGVFHPAEATIEGRSVLLRCDQVAQPTAVRFAFTNTAVVNLVNSDGLPASLFRADLD